MLLYGTNERIVDQEREYQNRDRYYLYDASNNILRTYEQLSGSSTNAYIDEQGIDSLTNLNSNDQTYLFEIIIKDNNSNVVAKSDKIKFRYDPSTPGPFDRSTRGPTTTTSSPGPSTTTSSPGPLSTLPSTSYRHKIILRFPIQYR